MGVYPIGDVIQKSRISLSLTQEELCNGICSVETLSRIENGKQTPSRVVYQKLLNRLGRPEERILPAISSKNFNMQQLKINISQAIANERYAKAEHLYREISKYILKEDLRNIQYLLRTKAVIDYRTGKIPLHVYTKYLLKALKITVPEIDKKHISDNFLNRSETIIILNIANAYGHKKDYDAAISLLFQLDNYYYQNRMDFYEQNYSRILVLTNLSIWLGRTNRFEEMLHICNKGIQISTKINCSNFLDRLLYNKALTLYELIKQENPNFPNIVSPITEMRKKTCLQCLQQAYCISLQFNHAVIQSHIKKCIEENTFFRQHRNETFQP